ncbi:hypothetical protein F3Y22_tig00110377pilonHSYRG00378 [Hibiscus syriacus]|uniref:Uncharacterized protein n=1 Tax=Hibiscus syriacus TaxID=106335 RepID=A0A6A3AXJ8_HIBSY|nr:hypothetical protein F3Y22_tig00110377pilonHSYRG00378 [Hibiscus syriacus]
MFACFPLAASNSLTAEAANLTPHCSLASITNALSCCRGRSAHCPLLHWIAQVLAPFSMTNLALASAKPRALELVPETGTKLGSNLEKGQLSKLKITGTL